MIKLKYQIVSIVFSICLISVLSNAESIDESYITGYVRAVLEREFDLHNCVLTVKEGVVTLGVKPLRGSLRERIINTLLEIPYVNKVVIVDTLLDEAEESQSFHTLLCETKEDGFLPTHRLFEPLIADPRWPRFSIAYLKSTEDRELNNIGSVSLGGVFQLYRSDAPLAGKCDFGIETAIFSIFDMDASSNDLINTDFWVSCPTVNYRKGRFSTSARLFHQSSHLGDEYLLRSQVNRVNISFEGASMNFSYDVLESYRVYGGLGYLFSREPSDLEPWLFQVGFEFKSPKSFFENSIRPIAGIDIHYREESHWDTDLSVRIGIRFEKPTIVNEEYQLMFEYYNGHTPHGQFYEKKIEFIGIGLHVFI
ncbi:MAG: DUF1207 domain-containing protein [Thermodesulfobacteriota bacterium]|nr:DUF1207 domain-containing protein [Thermodesulfobacteriota bacterium]